jgi:LemA protein
MWIIGLSTGIITLIVVVVVLVLIALFLIKHYNALVVLRNKVRNSFSQIDVQLKRRFDMIPNLVETVKGYAKHEESIFGEFARARGLFAQASKSGDVHQMAEADKGFTGALSRLMVVSEQYPELKANTNFIELMNQLKDTENKIAFSRQFYNDTVMKYNNVIELFPSNIVAGIFQFKAAEFFEVMKMEEREAVKVQF